MQCQQNLSSRKDGRSLLSVASAAVATQPGKWSLTMRLERRTSDKWRTPDAGEASVGAIEHGL
jgi:hypothetical protein